MTNTRLIGKFGRNAGFILGGRLWFVLIWFLATPFILESLGKELFGVWALLFLLSGYLATLDLGLATSVVRYAAVHVTGEKWDELNNTVGQITRLYLLLGALWVLVLFLGLDFIVQRIGVSEIHVEQVKFALIASAGIFAIANLISVGTGILNGLQRMDLSNSILVIASVPQIAVLLIGLKLGYALYAVVLSSALYWSLVAIGNRIAISKLVPRVRWPTIRVQNKKHEWLGFSFAMQLNNVLSLSQQQIDKLLLIFWLGVQAVADFELGFRVANAVRSFPTLMVGPLMPAFVEHAARSEWDEIRTLCRKGTTALSLIAFGLAACVMPAIPLLVRGWVGPGYPIAEILGQWLLFGFILNVSTGVGSAASRGTGKPSLETLPAIIGLAVHVAASWYLIGKYGAVGVGPALTLGMAVMVAIFFVRLCRYLDMPLFGFVSRSVLVPLLMAIPPGLMAWLISALVERRGDPGRVGNLVGAAAAMGGAMLVFGVILYVFYRRGGLRMLEKLVAGAGRRTS